MIKNVQKKNFFDISNSFYLFLQNTPELVLLNYYPLSVLILHRQIIKRKKDNKQTLQFGL